MPQSALRLGERIGPFEGRLGAERLRAFAVATEDPSWREPPGSDVPACAVATLLWTAQTESRVHLIPQPFQDSAAGGVHGEHAITLHRIIESGEALCTWVEGVRTRPVGRNSVVTLRFLTFDAEHRLVAEQWWTTVWLAVTCAATGDSAPARAFPAGARHRPTGTWEIDVEAEMARTMRRPQETGLRTHFQWARRTGRGGLKDGTLVTRTNRVNSPIRRVGRAGRA